jgi:hypothetical protein
MPEPNTHNDSTARRKTVEKGLNCWSKRIAMLSKTGKEGTLNLRE